jgi:hypothetical protein
MASAPSRQNRLPAPLATMFRQLALAQRHVKHEAAAYAEPVRERQ